MEDIILEFWRCSLRSDFSEFDWEDAFEQFSYPLSDNVIAHGLGTFEEYLDWHDEYYGLYAMECDLPSWATYDTMWGCFSDVDAVAALLKAKWEYMRDNFKHNVHGDLADLRNRILPENQPKNEAELIALFDECIHAEHATGMILDDVDIEDLREDAEEEWEEEQKEKEKFPTNIREFLTP